MKNATQLITDLQHRQLIIAVAALKQIARGGITSMTEFPHRIAENAIIQIGFSEFYEPKKGGTK